MYYGRINKLYLFFCILLFTVSTVFGQDQEFDKVQIETVKAADNVHMLMGSGGNIGVCTGDDGVFLVDDQFAPLTEKIKSAIGKISNKDVRFLINTHWHFDHVGGNENIGEAGAVIIAHENVRNRMSTDQFIDFFQKQIPASPKIALPIITFTQDLTFHLNEDEIHVFHVKNAHTDGDAIVYFQNSNVIHTGDIYFAGLYPFIDTGSHGSVNGVINAARYILSIINDDTKIIPGHGHLSNKAELNGYVDMLTNLRDKMNKLISEGKTLNEIQAAKPTQEYDDKWGHGFLSPNQFVQILYNDLSGNKK
jgi:glyoxylase-like metal-dependent hydrolase (beta-lactamase superfamily II)